MSIQSPELNDVTSEKHFTWVPFYEELAQRLKDYKNRQSELVRILDDMREGGLKVASF